MYLFSDTEEYIVKRPKNKNGVPENFIAKMFVAPGQMMMVRFYDMSDENELNEMDKNSSKYIDIPMLVTSVNITGEDFPVVDAIFFNRWKYKGEMGGYNKIVEFPIWRYALDKQVPQWFINYMGEIDLNDLSLSSEDLFYVSKDTEYYCDLVFPFRKSQEKS